MLQLPKNVESKNNFKSRDLLRGTNFKMNSEKKLKLNFFEYFGKKTDPRQFSGNDKKITKKNK